MSTYFNKALALAQDAARISAKVSETFVENAKEIKLELEGEIYDHAETKLDNISKELNSTFDKEVIIGLKRLVILIGRGFDVSIHFPKVVKNVASRNIEIRKLVYIYLLEYAEHNPDLALLSINTFQKDLSDYNQTIRAMALRVMSGIRIKEIGSIVVMAIRQCSLDPSAHVRKTAALAAIKLYRNNPDEADELAEIITDMMKEKSPLAIGSVVKAFEVICGNNYDLVHKNFRYYCQMLLDVDEWGQVVVIQMLVRYSRTQFENPNKNFQKTHPSNKTYNENEKIGVADFLKRSHKENYKLDNDHELLLTSLQKLLYSRNSAVIMAVVSAFFELMPKDRLEIVWKPLMRLVKSSNEAESIILTNIQKLLTRYPDIFVGKSSAFFINPNNSNSTRLIKLDLIECLVNPTCAELVLSELQDYIQVWNNSIISDTVFILAKCTEKVGKHSTKYISTLLDLLNNQRDHVVHGAIRGLCYLMNKNNNITKTALFTDNQKSDLMCALIRMLPKIKDSNTSAYVYRSTSHLTFEGLTRYGMEALKFGVTNFKKEDIYAKQEILTLCVILLYKDLVNNTPSYAEKGENNIDKEIKTNSETLVQQNPDLELLRNYLFTLARYDMDYSVRDWARLLRSFFPLDGDDIPTHSNNNDESGKTGTNSLINTLGLCKNLVSIETNLFELISKSFEGPEIYKNRNGAECTRRFLLGTLSLTIGYEMEGYSELPEWPEKKPDHDLRGNATDAAIIQESMISSSGAYLPGISPMNKTAAQMATRASKSGPSKDHKEIKTKKLGDNNYITTIDEIDVDVGVSYNTNDNASESEDLERFLDESETEKSPKNPENKQQTNFYQPNEWSGHTSGKSFGGHNSSEDEDNDKKKPLLSKIVDKNKDLGKVVNKDGNNPWTFGSGLRKGSGFGTNPGLLFNKNINGDSDSSNTSSSSGLDISYEKNIPQEQTQAIEPPKDNDDSTKTQPGYEFGMENIWQ
ncbi:hypothetical protein BB559_005199 [Furculomyces boomerangus]|uniref:AP-3 complex subunit beta n=1 Tax=Furculomyces boomerangus TaxID=61424 RepID=A0A2T9YA28_9FUNG|nr:hypothetical protein BB559_005199 [Furculomyces boomerangus]